MSANTNAAPAVVMRGAAASAGGKNGRRIAQDAISLLEASKPGTGQVGGSWDQDISRPLRACHQRDTKMARLLEKQSARDDEQETPA